MGIFSSFFENEIDLTKSSVILKVLTREPLCTFHNFRDPSYEPTAKILLEFEKANDEILSASVF